MNLQIYPTKLELLELRKPRNPKKLNLHKDRTRQSETAETDINNIVRNHLRTGVVNHINLNQVYSGPQLTTQTFHEIQTQLANAKSTFNELPSAIRDLCNNDPAELLNFVADEENHSLLRELGLLGEAESPAQTAAPDVERSGEGSEAQPSPKTEPPNTLIGGE